jgi:hypothetical protein
MQRIGCVACIQRTLAICLSNDQQEAAGWAGLRVLEAGPRLLDGSCSPNLQKAMKTISQLTEPTYLREAPSGAGHAGAAECEEPQRKEGEAVL